MDKMFFESPVFLKDISGVTQQVSTVLDAIEFLEEWPIERRGLVHEIAIDACYAAHDGRKPVETARKAIAMWGRRAGIVEDIAYTTACTTGLSVPDSGMPA